MCSRFHPELVYQPHHIPLHQSGRQPVKSLVKPIAGGRKLPEDYVAGLLPAESRIVDLCAAPGGKATAMSRAGSAQVKRFDMPGFVPSEHYIREMKRYGVLPGNFNVEQDPIDVFATDQAYWKSLWHHPGQMSN